jgi:GT2 family glycosyltransferase
MGARTPERPLLSIVVPTFNRVDLLRQTVASVLAQDSGDFELVVIDDASEDATWEYLGGLADDRVRTHRNPARVGLSRNFNRAVELSRGRYAYILQDDDLAEPSLVSTIADATARQPAADIVCFATCLIDGDGGNPRIFWQPAGEQLLPPPHALLAFAAEWGISTTQVVFARGVFDRLGGIDETLPIGSDAEMILRWMLDSSTLVIPAALARRRHWAGSTSSALEPTTAMQVTMQRLAEGIGSRARASRRLSGAELSALDASLRTSFLEPYS